MKLIPPPPSHLWILNLPSGPYENNKVPTFQLRSYTSLIMFICTIFVP